MGFIKIMGVPVGGHRVRNVCPRLFKKLGDQGFFLKLN
jgi:hypothetical protein